MTFTIESKMLSKYYSLLHIHSTVSHVEQESNKSICMTQQTAPIPLTASNLPSSYAYSDMINKLSDKPL